MNVVHEYRVWRGRKIIKRNPPEARRDTPAVYTALGYHWLMPFITALERAGSLRSAHPEGRAWEFVFLLDYREGSKEAPRARLFIRPHLSRNFRIPPISISRSPRLTVSSVDEYIGAFLPPW